MTFPGTFAQHRQSHLDNSGVESMSTSKAEASRTTGTQLLPPKRPAQHFRGDIQALRAFAVCAVIFNHLWPHAVPGGFIGVDIFFVISGFLISSHLFKDTLAGRKVNLLAFYSRRVRRLLPAAFLVLALSMAGVFFFIPFDRWKPHLYEILASAAYSENIFLAVQAVDYHAIGQKASVAQHYWSLSVEEQFYFIWPLLLMGCMTLAGRLRASVLRVSVIFVSLFTVVFLTFSIWFTWYSPAQAYFVTPVRFWEFGIGALTALAVIALKRENMPAPAFSSRVERRNFLRLQRKHELNRSRVAVVAWLILGVSLWLYSPQIPFPSATALLPAFAVAVLIVVGTATPLLYVDRVTSLPFIRWVGDVSYSLYLWHWPLIVIAPFALRSELLWWHKLAILVLTFILAGLSKPFVEDRGLSWAWLAANYRRTFVIMAVIIGLFAGATGVGSVRANVLIEEETARVAAEQKRIADEVEAERKARIDCFGPGALQNPADCPNVFDKPLSTTIGDAENYYALPPECHLDDSVAGGKFAGVTICDFRKNTSAQSRENTIMLVGDSHADQWKWPLYEIAKKHQLRLESLTLGGCPVRLLPTKESVEGQSFQFGSDCSEGVKAINAYIDAHPPKRIVQSQYAKTEPLPAEQGITDQKELYRRSFTALWKHWRSLGVSDIHVIADSPYNDAVRDVSCPALKDNPSIDCRVNRVQALGEDYLFNVVKEGTHDGVKPIDFTDAFCDDSFCYAVAGQMLVYFDPTHLNRQYSLKLVPQLEKELGY